MDRVAINPWEWQDARGFTQAWRIQGASSIVVMSGQGPLDPAGKLVGAGDFEAQAIQTFNNLGVVLRAAGFTFADVVRFRVYLLDMEMLPVYGRVKAEFLDGRQPASTAIGVAALAIPGMEIEVEAFAAC